VTLTDEFMLCTKLINKSERASNKAVMTLQTGAVSGLYVSQAF